MDISSRLQILISRRTSEWGSEGREFKSHRPDHQIPKNPRVHLWNLTLRWTAERLNIGTAGSGQALADQAA